MLLNKYKMDVEQDYNRAVGARKKNRVQRLE